MTVKMFFFKNHAESEAGRLVPDFFLFLNKGLYEITASCLKLSFNTFRQPSTWHTIKTNFDTHFNIYFYTYFDSHQLGIQKKQTINL